MKMFTYSWSLHIKATHGITLTGLISEVVFIGNTAHGHGGDLTIHLSMNIIVELTCIYLLDQLQAHKTNIRIQNYVLS